MVKLSPNFEIPLPDFLDRLISKRNKLSHRYHLHIPPPPPISLSLYRSRLSAAGWRVPAPIICTLCCRIFKKELKNQLRHLCVKVCVCVRVCVCVCARARVWVRMFAVCVYLNYAF